MNNKLNFSRLMALNPTMYTEFTNTIGQKVQLFEHPLRGDESPVIVVFPELNEAYYSDFYETNDLAEPNGEYQPVFMHGKLMCAWECDL